METSPQSPAELGDDKAVQLRETVVFLIVYAFCREARGLLRILSGGGLISRRQLYKTEEEKQKRFYESARETFFGPRSRPGAAPSPHFTALLSVANAFAEIGYLRNIEEVKYYLVIAAAVRSTVPACLGAT